jgi:heme oxygenase
MQMIDSMRLGANSKVLPVPDCPDVPYSVCECPTLRQALREATSESHARLHLHSGFLAIQNGTVDLDAYRALLIRLYGFHVAFEAAMGISGDRSTWLQEDLTALGIGTEALPAIPRCASLPPLDTPGRRLGALYVVEGAMLGGRQLARSLASLLGSAGSRGRHFFLGRGAQTSSAWNAYLEQLDRVADTTAVRLELVASAVDTFNSFEGWVSGWRSIK